MMYFIENSESWVQSTNVTHSYGGYMGAFFAFACFAFSILIYFLPAIVAIKRKHCNTMAILILNIFLGWTFFGWVCALVWSFTNNVKHDENHM